ncbi:MAG TPA: NADH-quinone oxidoreductase subunit A [Acidimicrobiales bacterium]|nr:NADH-quinone oxidoreductase subunit A [Acidimicrobiales bacterium]
MDQYLPILLLVVLALGFAIATFTSQRLLGPGGRLNPAKTGPYESGIAPRREPAPRFPVRFYLVAMIFIIFDIEVVFLYPFAVVFHALSLFGFIEMGSFVVVVFLAFAYLISEGALNWGPPKRFGRRTGAPVPRTISSSVRRVSRPGVVSAARPTRPARPQPARPAASAGAAAGPTSSAGVA